MHEATAIVLRFGGTPIARAILAVLAYAADEDGRVPDAHTFLTTLLCADPAYVAHLLDGWAQTGAIVPDGTGAVTVVRDAPDRADRPRGLYAREKQGRDSITLETGHGNTDLCAAPCSSSPDLFPDLLPESGVRSYGRGTPDERRVKRERWTAVVACFRGLFAARFGMPYVVQRADAVQVNRLPPDYTAAVLVEAVTRYFADVTARAQHGASIARCVMQLSRYLASPAAAPTDLPGPWGTLARQQGCTNPSIAFRSFLAYYRARGTRVTDWGALWEAWCLQHGARGCACQRRLTPLDAQRERESRARERVATGRSGAAGAAPVRLGDMLRLPREG